MKICNIFKFRSKISSDFFIRPPFMLQHCCYSDTGQNKKTVSERPALLLQLSKLKKKPAENPAGRFYEFSGKFKPELKIRSASLENEPLKIRPNFRRFKHPQDAPVQQEDASRVRSRERYTYVKECLLLKSPNFSGAVSGQAADKYDLLDALSGAILERDHEGFIRIFDQWWTCFQSHLSELNSKYLTHAVVCLGKLNKVSAGELRKKLTRAHLRVIERRFFECGEILKSPRLYRALFLGFSNLTTPRDYYSTDRFPCGDVIMKTVNFFKLAQYDVEEVPSRSWEYDWSLHKIIQTMANLHILPNNPDDLLFFIDFFQRAMQTNIPKYCAITSSNNSNYSAPEPHNVYSAPNSSYSASTPNNSKIMASSSSIDIYRFCRLVELHSSIPKAFFKWRLNPDLCDRPEFWLLWFKTVRSLLLMEKTFEPTYVEFIQEKTHGNYATMHVLLCVSCLNVAVKFDKCQELIDVEILLVQLLEKWLPAAENFAIRLTHEALQSYDTCLNANRLLLDHKNRRPTNHAIKNRATIARMCNVLLRNWAKMKKQTNHNNAFFDQSERTVRKNASSSSSTNRRRATKNSDRYFDQLERRQIT